MWVKQNKEQHMAIDRRVIQNIRQRRTWAESQLALDAGTQVAEELIAVCGMRKRGLDPWQLTTTADRVPRLLALAEQIEREEALLGRPEAPPTDGRQAV
jgi:hypothetical protein